MSDPPPSHGAPARRRRRLIRSRVLCVDDNRILLVEHQNPRTGERFWMLPGGVCEPGESFEQAAIRETREETGVDIRLVRRLRVPSSVDDVTYALFLAEPTAHQQPDARQDFSTPIYLLGARWYPIAAERPIGPLNPALWSYLAPLLARLASGQVGNGRRRKAVRMRLEADTVANAPGA